MAAVLNLLLKDYAHGNASEPDALSAARKYQALRLVALFAVWQRNCKLSLRPAVGPLFGVPNPCKKYDTDQGLSGRPPDFPLLVLRWLKC
jgi:hypothetical protein